MRVSNQKNLIKRDRLLNEISRRIANQILESNRLEEALQTITLSTLDGEIESLITRITSISNTMQKPPKENIKETKKYNVIQQAFGKILVHLNSCSQILKGTNNVYSDYFTTHEEQQANLARTLVYDDDHKQAVDRSHDRQGLFGKFMALGAGQR